MQRTKKIKGGKLLSLDIKSHDGIITNALISGDFFLYPEDKITELEHAFEGVKNVKELEKRLKSVDVIITGFDKRDLITLTNEILEGKEWKI